VAKLEDNKNETSRMGEYDLKNKDFYFRALGSLVIISFSQPLSFSSVSHKELGREESR
jgi:hypothetical protein